MDDVVELKLCDINVHVVCPLCAGYLIDATTVTECLHTFCKSCIVKYLQTKRSCPLCNAKVHETQPMLSLKLDRVMQELVYKLIPKLFDDEESRRQEFYQSRGLVEEIRKDKKPAVRHLTSVCTHPEAHLYCNDELICLFVSRDSSAAAAHSLHDLKKYVRCSSRASIRHLRLVLQRKLGLAELTALEVVCLGNVLSPVMTLKQVRLLFWHDRALPLRLTYRITSPDTSSRPALV